MNGSTSGRSPASSIQCAGSHGRRQTWDAARSSSERTAEGAFKERITGRLTLGLLNSAVQRLASDTWEEKVADSVPAPGSPDLRDLLHRASSVLGGLEALQPL